MIKQYLVLLFFVALSIGPIARADDLPDTFSDRAQTLIDSRSKVAYDLRSAFAGQFLSEIRQVSKQGLRSSKVALDDIIDAAKLLLLSDDPANVLLGLRILECVDYIFVVEISRQYASDRKEAMPVDFVEQSVDADLINTLAERREVAPKELLGHVLNMQGILQKELLAQGLNEQSLIEGVRLFNLGVDVRDQYESVTQDLRYLDALPDKNTGDYLLLESLYLCDVQSDVALLYKAYAQQPEILEDRSSFRTFTIDHITKHPSQRMLQGKSNMYVLMSPIALKLFFEKRSQEVKFLFFGERMWPFISGLEDGHGLTAEEKATIQSLVPDRSSRSDR